MRLLSILALAAAVAAGCAPGTGETVRTSDTQGTGTAPSPGTASSHTATGASSYARSVAPFDVLRTDGTPVEFPFLGGLNVPRLQLVDIDGDGDQDLYLQEYTGQLMHFSNEGTPGDPRFVFQTRRYEGLDIGEWFRFVDLDGDGDYDLLAEKRFSHIRYFLNVGSPTAPNFDQTLYALKDTEDNEVFSDRQNIPNITDIDCDGKLDLFIGRVDGTIYRYEAVDEDSRGVPRFELVSNRFENIEIIGEIQIGASLHGANTMAFHDFDDDGDEDLFWGDFFESGLLMIENSGSCAAPALQNEPVRFPRNAPIRTSGYNAPTFGDLDGDGHPDLLVGVLGGAFNPTTTSADNLYHLEQTEGRDFELRTTRFLYGLDVGMESIPALADTDGDGDLDLYITNKIDPNDGSRSLMYYLENTGTAESPSFQIADTLSLVEAYHLAPVFGDIDDDGDLDMIVGSWTKGIMLFTNEGTATEPDFVLTDDEFLRLTRGSNATPALVDIDGDGDLDLFAGESSGDLNFYENVGTASEPRFSFVSDTYAGFDAGRRSYIDFADLDADGDYDMIVSRDTGAPAILRNDGSPTEPHFVEGGLLDVETPEFATVRLVDLDADGVLDVVSGTAGGGLLYFGGIR